MRSPAEPSSAPVPPAPGDLRQARSTPISTIRAPADFSPAIGEPTSTVIARGSLDRGLDQRDVRDEVAPVDLGGGQVLPDAQGLGALTVLGSDQEDSDDHAYRVAASSNGHTPGDDHAGRAVGSDGNGRTTHDTPSVVADPSDALLVILADQLDDIEKARIAADNRLRSLRQVKGLAGSKAEATLQALADEWAAGEKRVALELKRTMRAHRFGPWVKGNVGLGEKQAARLIAAIGDPLWNSAEDRPRRGPAELWAYCGYRPDQGKRKGQLHSYNWEAKMRAFLCAESCMKQRTSPFRAVYDRERLKWADRGVADAHKHAHALRVVAKEILKSLWRFAACEESMPFEAAPGATEQLRTATMTATPAVGPPSDLQATSGVSIPIPAASSELLETA